MIHEHICCTRNVWARGTGHGAGGEDFHSEIRLISLASRLARAPSLTLPHSMGEGGVGDDEPS